MKKLLPVLITVLYSLNTSAQNIPFWLPGNGLVAWYPLNGNANDISGNGNNGAIYNTSLTTDRFGNSNSAYSFNGINSRIEVNDAPSLRVRKITLAFWVKNNSSTTPGTIVYKANISNAGGEVFTINNIVSQNNYSFDFKENSNCIPNYGWITHPINNSIQPNTWQFIAVTYDGNVVNSYVNGNLVSSQSSIGLIDSCIGGNLRFGYCWNAYPYAFNGVLDDIAVYNRALNACEIQDIYTQNAPAIILQPQNKTIPGNTNTFFAVKTQGSNLSYQWQQDAGIGFTNLSNAGMYSGVTTDTLKISNATSLMNNYHYRCIVSLSSSSICPDTSTTAILNITSTGVNEVNADNAITLYPNPTNSTFILNVKIPGIKRAFFISNQLGQQVKEGIIFSGENLIELNNLVSGIYFLKIENDGRVFKILKN